jgi:hypothetical protein
VGSRWSGLDGGRGHLLGRELTVRVEGRGAAARAREAVLRLPRGDPAGAAGVAAVA